MTEVTTWFTATLEKAAKGEVLKRLVQSGKKTIVRKVVLTSLFVASAHLPLVTVENEYFRTLTGLRVSRRDFTRVVRVVADMCRLQLRDNLSTFDMLSLTGDAVALYKKREFQSVTATGLNKKWMRGTYVLAVERMTGSITSDRIAYFTKRVADEMADEDCILVSMTTDGAEEAASEKVVGEGNALTCFSHTLQLVVNAGTAVPAFAMGITRIRSLVKFIRARRLLTEKVIAAKAMLGKTNKRARS